MRDARSVGSIIGTVKTVLKKQQASGGSLLWCTSGHFHLDHDTRIMVLGF